MTSRTAIDEILDWPEHQIAGRAWVPRVMAISQAKELATLRVQRDELLAACEAAQSLRPALLKQLGYVPECVLEFCNLARTVTTKAKGA